MEVSIDGEIVYTYHWFDAEKEAKEFAKKHAKVFYRMEQHEGLWVVQLKNPFTEDED